MTAPRSAVGGASPLRRASRIRTVSRETVLLPVHGWRLISRFLPARCKYYPSCSSYAVTAIRRHGVLRGVPMAAWRVLRCNPWSLGGVDYVGHRHGVVEGCGAAAPEASPRDVAAPLAPKL